MFHLSGYLIALILEMQQYTQAYLHRYLIETLDLLNIWLFD